MSCSSWNTFTYPCRWLPDGRQILGYSGVSDMVLTVSAKAIGSKVHCYQWVGLAMASLAKSGVRAARRRFPLVARQRSGIASTRAIGVVAVGGDLGGRGLVLSIRSGAEGGGRAVGSPAIPRRRGGSAFGGMDGFNASFVLGQAQDRGLILDRPRQQASPRTRGPHASANRSKGNASPTRREPFSPARNKQP